MAGLGKVDEAHFFLRQEMRCKLFEEHWYNRWPIHLFNIFGGFGFSVMRPLIWMAGLVAAGMVPMTWWLTCGLPKTVPFWPALGQGLAVSFSNTWRFLGFNRAFNPDFFKATPGWIEVIVGAQTLMGVMLLFFLGLALRNRFRLK